VVSGQDGGRMGVGARHRVLVLAEYFRDLDYWRWLSDAPWYLKPIILFVGYMVFGLAMVLAAMVVLTPYVLLDTVARTMARWWRGR